jgi:integrase
MLVLIVRPCVPVRELSGEREDLFWSYRVLEVVSEYGGFGLARYSIRAEQERSRNPKAYFGQTPLKRLTADNLREYIVWRKQQKPLRGDAPEISNRTVNMEVAFIRRLLKRAKRLRVIADDLKPLPERRDIGRGLAIVEKLRLIQAAKTKPEWGNARLALTLALNTTMRGCEIKGLQWRDVNLID